jgi:hypothetical protein
VRALSRLHPFNPVLTVWDRDRLVGVVTPQAIDRLVNRSEKDQSAPGRRADSWSGSGSRL